MGEHRRDTHNTGKSRFTFISPPAGVSMSSSKRRPTSGRRIVQETDLRFGSWKDELQHNVRHVPSRLYQRLDSHRDEVLFVVFSPCGSKLASCSRDFRTIIFRIGLNSTFVQEAILHHDSAACRAVWWPQAPYDTILVVTESTHDDLGGKLEIWRIISSSAETDVSAASPNGSSDSQVHNAQRISRFLNTPFDIYTALISWTSTAPTCETTLCFTVGRSLRREAHHWVQWLEVRPGPQSSASSLDEPLARLRLQHKMNYLHCLVASSHDMGQRILGMSRTTPNLCDQLCVMSLDQLSRRAPELGEAAASPPSYDVPMHTKQLDQRAVLSARWSQRGDFILLNTRPHACADSARVGQEESSRAAQPTFDALLHRTVPDLST